MTPRRLLAFALLATALTAGAILWTGRGAVVALLATVPFLILARLAWSRLRARPASGARGAVSPPAGG